MAQGIQDEEQFQALIKAELWYDSEEEGDSENGGEFDEPDTSSAMDTNSHNGQKQESPWEKLKWHPEVNQDDPYFTDPTSATSDDDQLLSVEEFLKQLDLELDQESFEEDAQEETNSFTTDVTKDDASDVTSDTVGLKNAESDPTELGASSNVPSSTKKEVSDSSSQIEMNSAAVLSKVPIPVQPDPDLRGETQIQRPKHYYIACEIMTTERTYVQNLRLVEKVLHGAIKTARLTGRPILPEQARKDIFVNIGEIYALNFDMLQELEDRIENWDSNPMIADVVAIRAPFFKLYTMYSSSFDRAQMSYYKWLKHSKPFAKLIKMIETGRLCKGLPLSSYMLCPIQRIPRYRLLLEDYKKHLPDGHPDAENTEIALGAIAEAAIHMNDRIKDLENQALIVKMQKSFTGKETIVAPGRKYLGRGPVFFVPGHGKKQRVLFLFSDILLVAAMTAYGRYKVRRKFSLNNLLVSVVQSPVLKNSFCVAEKGMTRPFRFCTKSLEERNKWITVLNKAKKQTHEPYSTLTSRSKLLNDPEVHSSILAVLTDPSFEHNQPSWVRRSLRLPHSARASLPLMSGMFTPPTHSMGVSVTEDVDGGGEEVVTEFVEDERQEEQRRALRPGGDNTLSCYMNQLGVDGEVWRRRWFVLTSRTLVCYESHTADVASGALSLKGYQLTPLEPGDGMTLKNVIKMICAGKRAYFFQLPSSYDFERWYTILKELLESEVNREVQDTLG